MMVLHSLRDTAANRKTKMADQIMSYEIVKQVKTPLEKSQKRPIFLSWSLTVKQEIWILFLKNVQSISQGLYKKTNLSQISQEDDQIIFLFLCSFFLTCNR